jgi:hypothetical protein
MNITISINEEMAAKLVETVVKFLSLSNTKGNDDVQQLRQTNAELMQKVSSLEQTIAKLAEHSQAKPPATVCQETKVEVVQQASKAQSKDKQTEPAKKANQPDQEKALEWAKQNLEVWLDQPCKFGKATDRTWRQLAQNFGDKIVIKGKPSQPRAYLHVIENWKDCNVWERVKAQTALQFVKNGNGVATDFTHPTE